VVRYPHYPDCNTLVKLPALDDLQYSPPHVDAELEVVVGGDGRSRKCIRTSAFRLLGISRLLPSKPSISNSAATYKRFDSAIPFHHGQLFITPSRSEEAPYANPEEGGYAVATPTVPHNYSDLRSPGYPQSYETQ